MSKFIMFAEYAGIVFMLTQILMPSHFSPFSKFILHHVNVVLIIIIFSQSDEIPEDILKHVTSVYKTPVSATSLAACLKVDSCYIPEKIPYLICSAAIGCLQVTLVNNFDTAENGKIR